MENIEYELRTFKNLQNRFALYKNWSSDINGNRFNTNCHSEIEIIYTISEEETIGINNDTYITHAGDLTVVNSGHIHTGIGEHWCHHAMIPPNDFLDHLGISIPMFSIQPHIQDPDLSRLFLNIIEETERPGPENFRSILTRIAAERFLVTLLRDYGTNSTANVPTSVNSAEFAITSKVLNFLNIHFAEDFSIDSISESIGVTTPYMCHCVKKITGASIIDHLKMIRCRAAHHYLMHTDKKINEIATLCGFNGRSYFAKVYREIMGVAPSEVDRSPFFNNLSEQTMQ